MTSGFRLLIAAAVLAMPLTARAGVFGVMEIMVYSNANGYVQIAELIATETGTGRNVALASLGATATASSSYSPSSGPDKAIDGIFPSSFPDIWHSGHSGTNDYLDVTFAAPADLDSVTIWGRVPATSRDVYDVYLYSASRVLLFTQLGADAGVANFVTVNLNSTDMPEPTSMAVLGLAVVSLWRLRQVRGSWD